MKEIKYLCYDCIIELRIDTYFIKAINRVGRKQCDRCGNNQDNLSILSTDEYQKNNNR